MKPPKMKPALAWAVVKKDGRILHGDYGCANRNQQYLYQALGERIARVRIVEISPKKKR